MAKCKDCNVCGWDKPLKFDNELCIFLCDDCKKKRGKND